MEYPISSSKYINQLIIKGLWNRFDVNWALNPDVNILVGEKGTGKSTILNLIANRWDKKESPHEKEPYLELSIMPTPTPLRMLPSVSESYKTLSGIELQFIKTFDAPFYTLTEKEMKRKPYIKSTLDEELENCIAQYVDYQLNISNEVIFNKMPPAKAFTKKLLFIETINRLFQITDKVMDVKNNKLAFKLEDGTKLNWYDLSSGEKQLLIILLTVLCQDEKPSILLLDEPEVSLHLEWQKELITIIRAINPNCQLIIVTHSPGIIMNGWLDKALEINDILKSKKQAIAA